MTSDLESNKKESENKDQQSKEPDKKEPDKKKKPRRCSMCGRILNKYEKYDTVCPDCKRRHKIRMSMWMEGDHKYPGGLH